MVPVLRSVRSDESGPGRGRLPAFRFLKSKGELKSVLHGDTDTVILLQHIDIEGWLANVPLAWLKCINNQKGRTSMWHQPIKAWKVSSSHISCGIYKWWVATFSPFQLSITYSDWQKLILECFQCSIFNDFQWYFVVWKYFWLKIFLCRQVSHLPAIKLTFNDVGHWK